MPQFSVVIPLYNKEKYIQRAIDSVLAQTVSDFECIIVNDGSTDRSYENASAVSDSRIHIINQENVGLAGARNRGMDAAQADFIALLDADDEWEPDFLETIARLIKKYPHAGAYGTARQMIFAGGKVKHCKVIDIPDTDWEGMIEDFFKAHALGASPLHPCSVCIPKKVYKELGGFPFGVKLYEDLFCWINIALHYPIAYSTKIGAKYYRDMAGTTFSTVLPPEISFERMLLDAMNNGDIKKESVIYAEEILAKANYIISTRYLVANKIKDARNWAKRVKTKNLKLRMKVFIVILLSFFPYPVIKYVGSKFGKVDVKFLEKPEPGST